MEADDDWVVLTDGDGSDSASDDGSDDLGFVRVRKGGGGIDRRHGRSVVFVPRGQGPFAVISYREAFSAPSPGDGGSGCQRSDLFFDDTTIREALFGAGCSGQGAGADEVDCECEVGEHGGASGSSVVKAPSVPAAAARSYPLPSLESETTVSHGEALSELASGMEEEDAGSCGEEVEEDEKDAETSGEEEDEDLDHSSEEDDDGMESFGEEEDDDDEYTESCSEEENDDAESFGEEEDDDGAWCTESWSEEGEDDDDGEYIQSCSEENDDGTESFSEEEEDDDYGACTESEEEDDRCYYEEYTESCSDKDDDDDDADSLGEDDDDEYTESCSEEEDDAESSGEEAVMEEESSSHIADCEHHQDKFQAGNEGPPAFPVNKYDTSTTLSPTTRASMATSTFFPPRRGAPIQSAAAIEAEKELLDFCPCKYDGICTGGSGMGEGMSLDSDEQRGSAENDQLSELVCKILELLGSDEEDDETSSSDMEQSDSDEDDGVDGSDADATRTWFELFSDESSDEEEPVGISYDDIDCSEEEEEDDGEEEKEEEEQGDEEEHGFDVVDAAVVAQRDVARLDVPPGQRRPGSPTADLTFLVVVYLLVYLAFSYMVMLLQELA